MATSGAPKRAAESVDLATYKPAPTHANVHAALAALQAELPAIGKSSEAEVPTKAGGKYSYSYADLAAIWAVLRPLLGRHGLGITHRFQPPRFSDEGRLVEEAHVATRVFHAASATELETVVPLLGEPQRMQDLASAITYARRYGLHLALGIVTEDEDDDGHAAQAMPQRGGSWAAERAEALSREAQQAHAAKASERLPPASPAKVTKNQITVLWATAGARAKELGDESITRETIVRDLLQARGLASSGDIQTAHFDEIVKAARRWTVPVPSDEIPPDDVPVDEAAAEEAFN
jgi:hypothetical protein